jgi:hypothetical protein
MSGRLLARSAFLATLLALTLCRAVVAQAPACDATLAPKDDPEDDTKIIFNDVQFRGENPLSEDARAALVKQITGLQLFVPNEEPDSEWLPGPLNPVRLAVQQQGYYQSQVDGTLALLHTANSEREYSLNLSIQAGTQYRVGDIRFVNATIFSTEELREHFRLQPADVFDTGKLVEGMNGVRRMYAEKGYIDFILEPAIEVDEEHRLVNLSAKVTEGPQYQVAKVYVLGLVPDVRRHLTQLPETGQIFDQGSIDMFLTVNQGLLPAEVSSDRNLRLERDSNGRVDVVLDFREACPNAPQNLQITMDWRPELVPAQSPNNEIK